MGHIIYKEGITMDLSKVEAVQSWPTPKNVKEVRFFSRIGQLLSSFCRGILTNRYSFDTADQEEYQVSLVHGM